MRIQVLFHNDDTWVVVSCGDGKITISELINRATVRFKKITNTHHDDDLRVGSICLHHNGTYIDRDDEVADVLENNEAVVLQQTSWVSCIGNNTSNPQVTVPGTSQDTKVLSGRRAFSVQSVDSGFIATQSSRNSQDGTSYGQNSQIVNLQPQPSPYHNVNLSVGSLSPSPFLGVAARPLAHPLQRVKQESGISLWGKHHHRPESGVLIDEDDDTDTDLENEDFDSSKKNMLPDESGDKSGVQENLDVLPYTSLSECSHTPSPVKDSDDPEQNTDREEEEYAKYGEIHIIELRKGDKPLGIHLVDVHTSTSSEDTPGVFIGAMDENGCAFKSGKFHYNDRILGCNGVDFTRKGHSEPVKDIFNRMAQEPVLKIAIGRGHGVGIPIATDNGGTKEIDENVSSCDETTPTTPMNTIMTDSEDHDHTSYDNEKNVGEDTPSVVIQLESEDAAPTITPSSLIPQILVSQQMPPSQQSNPTSTLEQKQLSLESNTNEKLTTDINDSTPDSESLKPIKKEDTEIVIPQLKSVIGPGQATWDLRCVEVCEETSVVVQRTAQQFIWEGFGLKLHIYDDCLPADMDQCIIHMKASLAGLYKFPENTHPVSAVFWLRCVPECKFSKSVGLEIQHCGKPKGDSRLSFARAICCQKQLPYTFKGIGGDFTNHTFYGFIELKGFSGLAVVQQGSEERYYLASLLYKEVSSHRSRCIVEIYIALTWNVDAHSSILSTRLNAFMETQQPIEFESDQVEFKISNISKKWDIKCLNSPVVKKADVDRFTPGKTSWVPSSKFKAKFSDDLNLVCDLECDVDVIGAMQPHNKFVVDICPQAGSSQQPLHQYPPPEKSTSTRLTDFDCTTLLQQLQIHAAKWKEIGIHLGFRPGELDNIQSNAHLATDMPVYCLREMLTRWLQWAPEDSRGSTSFATLEALKTALTKAGLGAAAHDLHL